MAASNFLGRLRNLGIANSCVLPGPVLGNAVTAWRHHFAQKAKESAHHVFQLRFLEICAKTLSSCNTIKARSYDHSWTEQVSMRDSSKPWASRERVKTRERGCAVLERIPTFHAIVRRTDRLNLKWLTVKDAAAKSVFVVLLLSEAEAARIEFDRQKAKRLTRV